MCSQRALYSALAALPLLLVPAGCQRSDEYPNRPITLICPWSVGGGTDQVSRQAAMLLEQELGVPVNVINATGGAGVTGHQRGALARPDGYTLTMATIVRHACVSPTPASLTCSPSGDRLCQYRVASERLIATTGG